jgi:gluconolactonase
MSDLKLELVTEGLQFPEGPVVMADGSVIVVEIPRGA